MELYSDTAQDENGDIVNGASVSVTISSGGAPATLYDKDGGALDNPFLTGYDRSKGEIEFQAANGLYNVTVTGNPGATKKNQPLLDPTDFSSTGIDDNATSTSITIDSNQDVKLSGYTAFTTAGFYFRNANPVFNAVRDGGNPINVNRLTSNGDIIILHKDTVAVGSISVTGSATAYNTSSDYRLKENVIPMTGSIDRLKQLKPSRFNFISDPTKTVDGFLAHEAGDVVSECAAGEKDATNEDGTPDYQGIDQSKLVPLLTAALQEAIERIEALEARL